MADDKNATSAAPLEEPVSESSSKEEENRVTKTDEQRQVSNTSDCTTLDDALTRDGKESKSETLASVPSPKSDHQVSEVSVKPVESVNEVKDQEKAVHEEPANTITVASTQLQNQVPDGLSRLDLSPTSTPPLSSISSPSQPQQKLQKIPNNKRSITEVEKQKPPLLKLSPIPLLKTPSDGYNWRKYGQKQVKSPEGSRSYYRCTSSDCYAKKIECSDLCHRVIETVYRSHHNHDPPPKLNCSRENRSVIQSPNATGRGSTNATHPVKALNDIMPSTSKEPLPRIDQIPETKQQESNDSDETIEINAKDGHVDGPEYKKRKNETPPDELGTLPKPVNKPKFVVHAADDVGISGDGYRWRKYGQKMVKGNPHPRNYYRCTSAGCPVRKHIEKAVDSATALIITYKGGHNHDMPVPKKRHGPKTTRISGSSVSGVSLQTDKSEIHQSQEKPSMDKEGMSGDGALNLIAKKKAESTPALLSVGFEIKPCSNH